MGRGGRARRAEGGLVIGVDSCTYSPTPLRRGGRAKSREHHFLGAMAGALLPTIAAEVHRGSSVVLGIFGGARA